MKRIYDVNLFHDMLIEAYDRIEQETDFAYFFHDAVNKGVQNLVQETVISQKKFDDMWIKTVESYFPSLDKITRNLKSVLRYDEELVIVEKARKTTRRAVEHLSSHAQYIKEVKNNTIVPKKILTSQSEIEYGIYENRFVKTLINRLERFIKDRVDVIAGDIRTKRETKSSYQNELKLEGNTFNVDIQISQHDFIENNETDADNNRIYQRALKLHTLISSMKNGPFMKLMKPYKEVSSPVAKTQIILKNPDFNNAYLLWLFLEQYHHLGYVLESQTQTKEISPAYLKHMMQTSLLGLSSLIIHNLDEVPTADAIKRRVERSIPKIVAPTDLKISLNDYDLSPQTINEYYLNRSRELFDAQLEVAFESTGQFHMALKEVLTATLQITNSLYATYFQINTADHELFNRLIQKKDPQADYEQAKERHQVAKIIREVKELDYKEAIALEKKWQEQVLDYGKVLLESSKKDELLHTQETVKEAKNITDALLKAENKKLASDKTKTITEYRKALKIAESNAKKRIDTAIKKVKDAEKEKRLKAKQKEKMRLLKQKEKLKLKQQQTLLKLKEKNKADFGKIRDKEQQRLKNIIK